MEIVFLDIKKQSVCSKMADHWFLQNNPGDSYRREAQDAKSLIERREDRLDFENNKEETTKDHMMYTILWGR